MKKIFKLSLVASVVISSLCADDIRTTNELNKMFQNGKVGGEIRSIYVGNNSDAGDSFATAFGGMISYESASLNNITAGFGFSTSEDINSLSGEADEKTDELSSSSGNYTVLSESYLNYKNDSFNLRVGRQIIDTPLADSDDIRMIKNSFEAYMAKYETSNINITVGNLQKWQGVDAGLDDGWVDTGDGGTWLGGISYSSDIEISAWYYNIGKLTNALYADAQYAHNFSEDMKLVAGVQYLKETEIDNSGVEANVFGASLSLNVQDLGLSISYNQSGMVKSKGSFSGFGGGTLYTNMDTMILDEITQDSDADAFVICLDYAINALNFTYAYGDFSAEDSNSLKSNIVEQDIGLEYSVNDNFALSALYVLSNDKEDGSNDWNRVQLGVTHNF